MTRKFYVVVLMCVLLTAQAAAADVNVYSVSDFGAVGDGQTLNTKAIQKAIDTCSQKGGGRVLVASGKYVTGTLFLKDNVDLHVANGAVLLGSTDIDDYSADVHKMMYKNESHMDRCLIFARDADCIAITGQGVIDARGQVENFPKKQKVLKYRPLLLRLINCTNIRMRDITLKNPAAWATAWLYCSDIVVDGITISSRVNNNGDGLDFDGCQNVRVSNCAFDTSDDSICLQASRIDKPCRDVVITNCIFTSKWAGIRIGLLSRGNLERVTVDNCIFRDIEDSGLKIQMCEGGTMQNMVFSNLVMSNVPRPIFMTFCQQRACVDAPEEPAPMKAMKNFTFSNILADLSMCDQNSAIIITGMPGHPIENVRMNDIQLITGGGGTKADGTRRTLPEYTLETLKGWWPEYSLLDGAIPCHGVYARHIKGLTLDGFKIVPAKADARPAIVCDDVSDLELSSLNFQGNPDAESVIRLQNVQDAYIHNSCVKGQCRTFVHKEGTKTKAIHIADDNMYHAAASGI